MKIKIVLFVLLLPCFGMALQKPKGNGFSKDQVFHHVETLSSDAYEGRRSGQPGNKLGRVYIMDVFQSYGIDPFKGGYEQPFSFSTGDASLEASNVIGFVKGRTHPDKYIVISAHHDHIGKRGDAIYNGADDNASGIGALFAFAEYLSKNPPEHSVILAAFDAEEIGLQGSKYFVKALDEEDVVLNINIDMIGRSAEDELYVVGSRYYPKLDQLLQQYTNPTNSTLKIGHDGTDNKQDWTYSSDHAPFHQRGIPFLYFGNEDHKAYHQPDDEFEYLTLDFYSNAITIILSVFDHIDSSGLE